MLKPPRRVRTHNPYLYLLIVGVALVAIIGGGLLWYRQQQESAQASLNATSAAAQALSQGQTAIAQADQGAATATAAAALAAVERRYQAAVSFQTAGDYEKARAGFQEVIALSPGYKDSAARLKQTSEMLAEGYYQSAVAAADQKLWAEALANFDKVLALAPSYKDTATRRAAAAKALNATATPKPATSAPQPTATTAAATATIEAPSEVVTATSAISATSAAAAPSPAPTKATSLPSGAVGKPAGDWAVRSYNTDDIGVVLVNGQLVAATTGGYGDSQWVKINEYLTAGQENEIAVASWDLACCASAWGFGVQRNDTQIWGSEEHRGSSGGMSYVQRLRITADGQVVPLPADTTAPKPPPGKWYVRTQGTQDVGVVLVNGVPTVLGASGSDSGWIEITGQLSASHDNAISLQAWNFDGDYSYGFDIKHDDTIIWGQKGKGAGSINRAFNEAVTIDKQGHVVLPAIQGGLLAQSWAVRSYNTDDIGVVLVNGQLVAATTGGYGDSQWVKINEYLTAGQENEIAVASWDLACCASAWGFGVQRNDTQIWGSEEHRGSSGGMSYVQRLRITADGQVVPLPADTTAPKPPPGKWYVRTQGTQDVGVVLVNGVPTVLGASGSDSGWIEITGQLSASHDNIVTAIAWNFDGPYTYKFAIKHDDMIVWGAEKSGGGQIGVVLAQPVHISAQGEVKQAP